MSKSPLQPRRQAATRRAMRQGSMAPSDQTTHRSTVASSSSTETKQPAPPAQEEEELDFSLPILDSDNLPSNLRHLQADLLSQDVIDKMKFNIPNKQLLRRHCIAEQRIVLSLCYPDGYNENFHPLLQFFQNNAYWDAICRLWELCEMSHRHRHKKAVKNLGLNGIQRYFQEGFGVDIAPFCIDINARYNKDVIGVNGNWNMFVMRMTEYTLRWKQNSCVCKGCTRNLHSSGLFGGRGQSDHPLQNFFRVMGVLKKKFGLDCNCLKTSWARFLSEFAKICSTCDTHHEIPGCFSSDVHELPNECSQRYALTDMNNDMVANIPPVAPCLVQGSQQMKAIQSLTKQFCKDMSGRDLCHVTYDEIAECYNKIGMFAFVDLHRQTPEKWLASNAEQRRCAIRRTEMTAEKSLCRCCFLCNEDIMNLPAKSKSGFHLHHMYEILKNHDPSQGIMLAISKQRGENRKTIMLCASCHMLVTYDEEQAEALAQKFSTLGYYIVKTTGEIRCTNDFDDYCVTIV